MYAILDALAAGSGCLHDIAYGGTGNDTNADDGDDTDQVADSVARTTASLTLFTLASDILTMVR